MAHYDTFQAQRFSRRQDWSIDRWCRGLRISRKRIERNPYFADLATLLMFDCYQSYMTSKDKDIWTHCWQWVYNQELPLTLYHKRKLTSIIDHIELRHIRQHHINQRKFKKRQNPHQAR